MNGNRLIKIVKLSVWDLPTPVNIRYFWNFGRLLGICLGIQLIRGIFLRIHYSRDLRISFFSVRHIVRDVNNGWLFRIIHANGARLFFICLYLHIARGIYYVSFRSKEVWLVGCRILLILIAIAFLGYVLPWGQMSFWGATVITNLFSAIPYIGGHIVNWLWGGFRVGSPTLVRFFALHYLLPFILRGLVLVHLLYLHERGSNNPLGLKTVEKVKFSPYYLRKDLFGIFLLSYGFIFFVLMFPWALGDTENFIEANPLVTPVHIQPEWYFLFAYAILRAIPNKLGGVMALALSVVILYFFIFSSNVKKSSFRFPLYKINIFLFFVVFVILTWAGACPVEVPYVRVSQRLTFIYFFTFFLLLF